MIMCSSTQTEINKNRVAQDSFIKLKTIIFQ